MGALPPSTAGTGMLGALDAAPPEPVDPAPEGAVAPVEAPTEDAVPPPALPKHSVDGMHVNPSPQSVSTLHENCHL